MAIRAPRRKKANLVNRALSKTHVTGSPRALASSVVRAVRRIRNAATITFLKCKGCKVKWSAVIHPDAVFERSGGQISIGKNTFVDKGVIVRALGGVVSIGDDCSVNAYSLLSGSGGIRIGDSVRIASHVTIVAANHVFSDSAVLIRNQGLSTKGIAIEDDVWIGSGVRVLDGVIVSYGCVLAAGAVVTRSTVPLSIVAGVPGRTIGSREAAQAAGDSHREQ